MAEAKPMSSGASIFIGKDIFCAAEMCMDLMRLMSNIAAHEANQFAGRPLCTNMKCN